MITTSKWLTDSARRLRSDVSGVAMIEFAYALPLLLVLGGYGVEMSNMATVNQKVSQAALALADNMSRVGAESALSVVQIRESDVNDSFIGLKRQTGALNLTANGRVILSSLEQNASGGQWIHWQRCIGTKNVASSYGTQGTGATGTSFPGMGTAAARVTAPPNSAVMFVEIEYDYRALFGTMFFPQRTIRYEASFVVRDDRDMSGSGIFNPAPTATASSCGTFTA
jgi:hypothetical protein